MADGRVWQAVGTVLSPIASGLGSRYAAKVQKRNVDKTIAASKAEAELAYQRQVEMWHMQNAYNSPEEQMRRFGAAGLNPHLIYGQGGPGNASDMPKYQPADMQYRYVAPAYGEAVASVIPQLMAVGSWMQQMRLQEAELKQREQGLGYTGIKMATAEEMLEQMRKTNPQLFQQLANKTQMQNYQFEAAVLNQRKVAQEIENMRQEYRHKFGEDLYQGLETSDFFGTHKGTPQGGLRALERIEQLAKAKLAEAKASYTDYGVTDPQALMQLVFGAVMGMAGTQLKMRTAPKAPVKKERPRGLVRSRMSGNHPDRRR